ncbi:LysM domain-containing protein [Candidatus Saccharibacteria bacterium]|nr:LysM domain-containing protein [Candidatus Saccharibacteria bacterium]
MPSMRAKEIIMKKIVLALAAIVFGVALFGATYTVKQGDTLEGIATANGVAAEQLAAANSVDPPYIIWVGQVLELPQVATTQNRTTQNNEGGGDLLLPNLLNSGSSSSNMSRQAFVWSKEPSAGGGAGYFFNDNADGYYRYANAKWQPVALSSKVSFGVWGEIGDDFCQVAEGDWSQSALGFKVGPVLDFYTPGHWFNCWSAKVYYGFRHADSRDGTWNSIQEDETWSANLWVGVHQGTESWFNKTSVSAEYAGLIEADAVGGNDSQYLPVPAYSPIKWESSLEQSLYKWGNGSLNLNLGYRHLDGEADPGKDRFFSGVNIQFGWAKVLYELEIGQNKQQKFEAQVSF